MGFIHFGACSCGDRERERGRKGGEEERKKAGGLDPEAQTHFGLIIF